MDQKDISKTLMLSSFVIRFSMHIDVDLISIHILRDTSSFHIAEEGGEDGVESEEGWWWYYSLKLIFPMTEVVYTIASLRVFRSEM